MPISRATTAWVVSGALGLTSFTIGMIASQSRTEAVPAEPRPAITVSVDPSARPTVEPSQQPTASPSTADPTVTADTSPSPVTPPSPETPD